MLPEFIKLAGLKLISAGLKAPENPLDRFIEFTMLKQLMAKLEIETASSMWEQIAGNLPAI
jgi:hypothetical protein